MRHIRRCQLKFLGMNATAFAGAEFLVTENEDKAKEISEFKNENSSKKKIMINDKSTIFEKGEEKEELNVIIKSDVHGSSEALKNGYRKNIHPEVKQKIILSEIGMINETDISLAKASNAVLIGFNVKANREAKKISEEQKIEIKYFNIIYEAIEYIEKRLSGLLEPDIKEISLGSAEVQKIFKVSKFGKLQDLKL